MSHSPAPLAVESLRLVRGERLLLDGLSLQLRGGEALWLQGDNGAGKTSLLRLLAGLAPPLEGSLQREAGLDSLYLGHRSGLKAALSAVENLLFAAQLAGQPCTRDEALQALAATGLQAQAQRDVADLSEGQARRVALAQLWLPAPARLWLLDEPLAALDAALQQRLAARLRVHLATGGLLVFSSHQALDLAGLPLRRLQLQSGRPRAWTLH